MSSGFNTDVRVGERVFHVQTEDRGPARPLIDTLVYQNGRILHRRASDYAEFAQAAGFSPASLRELVERQHREVIESLRAGALVFDSNPPAPAEDPGAIPSLQTPAAAPAASGPLSALQVELLNPDGWLSAGRVFLELEILRGPDGPPETGAEVEAWIEGALTNGRAAARSDEQGRASIEFPLPPLGKGDLSLVILAVAGAARGELRYLIRSKAAPRRPENSPIP